MAAKFNIKSFFINHCEKVVGVAVALLAMWGLAGATWETASTRPEQLTSEVEKVRKTIAGNAAWTDEQREKFAQTVDIQNLATELGKRDKLDFDRFNTQIAWHPNPSGCSAMRINGSAISTKPRCEPSSTVTSMPPGTRSGMSCALPSYATMASSVPAIIRNGFAALAKNDGVNM